MADGDPIIIGQANTASNPGNVTSLYRNEDTARTVFDARNLNLGNGILGVSVDPTGIGVHGVNNAGGTGGRGVVGVSINGLGILGLGVNPSATGVHGESGGGIGVFGNGMPGGFFDGGITVVNGAKNFKIDHPLDPENRCLLHTCVESSEMKNVYDGLARLDEDGAAWVELPEWFETLNGDLRYQLTAVGGPAPNLHVAEEVSENRFKIAGGEEGMKVCWQLTGSRKDRWAAANPFEVEQEKREEERGRYLEPGLYGAPEEQRVMLGPRAKAGEEEIDELRRLEEEQRGEMEELRRRMDRQEEPPPEST